LDAACGHELGTQSDATRTTYRPEFDVFRRSTIESIKETFGLPIRLP
jgi:hypothetical protein